jgi:hypothetical protein
VIAVGHDAERDKHAAGRERDVEWALAIGRDAGRGRSYLPLSVTPRGQSRGVGQDSRLRSSVKVVRYMKRRPPASVVSQEASLVPHSV